MRALPLFAIAMLCIAGSARADGLSESQAGEVSLANEEYQLAILHYATAIHSPDLPADQLAMSYRQRGIANFQINRADLAILDFTSAIWLNGLTPDQTTRTYYNRGLAYEVLGESPAAIADLTAAIERNPNYAEAYNSRGHVFRKLHQYEQALADFTASYRQGNPEPHLPMYGLAMTYEEMGKTEEAKAWYSQALKTKPDFEPAIEKVHPDQVAIDAAPVPAIESETLLPPAQEELKLRKEFDVAEAESENEMDIATDVAPSQDPGGLGGPLITAAEADDGLPTLVDEPVPPEDGDTDETVAAALPQPHQKPTALEPAAAPPDGPATSLAEHVSSAAASTAGAPETSALALPLRQSSADEESDLAPASQLAAASPSQTTAAKNGGAGPTTGVEHKYQVQLGSYASPAIAESEAMRLKAENKDLLGEVGHEVQKAVVGTKTYFRLRGTDLTFVSALRLCKGLQARHISCVVSAP